MSGLTPFQLVAAGVHFVPAVVWAIVAQNSWRLVRTRNPRSRFYRMLPIVGSVLALAYCLFTVIALLPESLRQEQPAGALVVTLYILNDWFNFTVVALARHMARFFPAPEEPPPSRAWLAVNYGSSAFMNGLAVVCIAGLVPAAFAAQPAVPYRVVRWFYQFVMLGAVLWQVSRATRPGPWAPASAAWAPRHADVLFVGGGLLSVGSWMLILVNTDWRARPAVWDLTGWGVALDAIAGIGFAAPLAMRILGDVVRGSLIVAVTLAATAAIYFGAHPLGASLVRAELQPLIDVGALAALMLLFVPGQSWLRTGIDHVVFRRSRRRREQLQAFLHTLSPDLGARECCRRALAQVADVMPLRGAAILLTDGTTEVHGTITLGSIEHLWPDHLAADALPEHALVGYELRELPPPLAEALIETTVVGVVPITSPRRRWGLLLISTGLLGATFSEEDERALESFADQLAHMLDGTELLARALAVERALAHSEKLAAIGELAARVAHEIRNPVAAARSLAQQMGREPTAPVNGEHAALIVTELDRVERQVAALLRFARREEFNFESVDLSDLARTTIAAFGPRLKTAGVALELDVHDDIVAHADREKLRQVLINLIENAIDALADAPARKQLSLAVGSRNGTATLHVADSGCGAPPEALPRLFEPFFSLKPKGTGLGLAIAKRTVEAHGGTIHAAGAPETGLTVTVELPLRERAT